MLSAGRLATALLRGVRSLGWFRTVVPPDTPGEVITTGLPLWQLAILAGLFVALVVPSLIVLPPAGEWAFQFDPTRLVRVFDTSGAKAATLAALYRDFAIRLDGHAKANGRRLDLRVAVVRAAIATRGSKLSYCSSSLLGGRRSWPTPPSGPMKKSTALPNRRFNRGRTSRTPGPRNTTGGDGDDLATRCRGRDARFR